jgi:hypothetical protein
MMTVTTVMMMMNQLLDMIKSATHTFLAATTKSSDLAAATEMTVWARTMRKVGTYCKYDQVKLVFRIKVDDFASFVKTRHLPYIRG